MHHPVMIDAAVAVFKQNLLHFCESEDMERLSPALAERVAKGLQEALAAAGVAGYKAFLQTYERQEDVVVAQGEAYRFNSVREKTFLTPFGKMVLARRCYQNKRDDKSHVPLDAAWGMEGQYMAPQVREAVLFACGHITPEETAALLEKSAMFHPHPTAIKHVVGETGALIESHREALDAAIRSEEKVPEGTRALAVSMDGASVLLNEKGTAAGRAAQGRRSESGKEGASSYRIAMVGSISCYGAPQKGQKTPQRLAGRYAARMPEEGWPTLKAQLEAEVAQADAQCPQEAARILLMDGARALWKYAEESPLFKDFKMLIDYWHMLEHLAGAADALFGKGSPEAKKWYEGYGARMLLCDETAYKVQRSMTYYEKKLRLSPSRRKDLEAHRTFFRNNSHRMNYATFRKNGWPIGSGPIEAACKTLVKTRLCRSGMRWSRQGGQAILSLRTYIKSNRWDAAWQHIKELPAAA